MHRNLDLTLLLCRTFSYPPRPSTYISSATSSSWSVRKVSRSSTSPSAYLVVIWRMTKLTRIHSRLNPGSIPVFDSARVKNDAALGALRSRCEAGARPLGIFRSTESEFLLVYDTFGFFVDRHGYPNRDMRAIEWEGRPESVGFHPPYVVLFSAPFMEIRHISDGRLLQIYCAKDLRCSWE